jgi:hypothetical protein
MSPINLHGRVVGKTELGMILVAITIEEYLETLPTVDPSGKALAAGETARIPDGMTRGVPFLDAAAQVQRDPPAAKQKRELTPKQKAFGAIGLKHRGTGPKQPNRDPRACEVCGKTYTPKRRDQRACGKPCRISSNIYSKGKKPAPALPPAPAATVADPAPTGAPRKLTMAEMKAIRDRVYAGKKPGLGATLAATSEIPSEFSQAQREAAQE